MRRSEDEAIRKTGHGIHRNSLNESAQTAVSIGVGAGIGVAVEIGKRESAAMANLIATPMTLFQAL